MDRRDEELLGKQLHGLTVAPRGDGAIIVTIVAVFLAGVALGSFLFAYKGAPLQIAWNNPASSLSEVARQ
jgi:hypothetical protein